MQLAASIYERHKGMMLHTAEEHLRDTSLAQDVVHDAVIRLAHYADTLRPLGDDARARYARETVRSVALNCERKLGIERRYLQDADADDLRTRSVDPESDYIERDADERRLRCLREALDELDEDDRTLLVGKYFLGASDEELARRLGLKPASVRMRLTRVRREVRRMIERKENGHG